MTGALHYLSIAEVQRRFAAGSLSPVALCEHMLARIAELNPRLRAYVLVAAERARADAARAVAEMKAGRHRGPLHGIPVALKDIMDTAGIRTTAHSGVLVDRVPAADSTVAARLAEAGAVLMGKLATHEFATGGPSDDLPFPRALNPWNPERFAGGSSSGSGVAAAAGLAFATLGSDTSGSIRFPCAHNGVAGVKPTYGRVPRSGVVPLSWSLDHVGPLCWTMEDCAVTLQAIAGHDPADPGSADRPVPDYAGLLRRPLQGLTIGVPRRWFAGDAQSTPEMLVAFDEAMAVLAREGCTVREVELPPLADYTASCHVTLLAEAFAIHRADLAATPERYGEFARDRLTLGAFVDAGDYLDAQRLRAILVKAIGACLADVDALALPVVAMAAPPVASVPKFGTWTSPNLAAPFSIAGSPVACVCMGFSADGIPLGLQIGGRPFEEATVMAIGHAYEVATPWRRRRPLD